MDSQKKETLGSIFGECLKSILIAIFKILAMLFIGLLKLLGMIASKFSELMEEKLKK